VVRTVNGGQSWRALPGLPAGAGVSVGIDFWSARAGVAVVSTRPGANPYFVTRDGGQTWQPLRVPGWSLVQGGVPIQVGDALGASVCFAPGGTGWVVASRAGHRSVLESPDGGRHWQTALPWQVLPGKGRAGVAVAGCTGNAAWVAIN
jgi:BNR/Asp-box repeat